MAKTQVDTAAFYAAGRTALFQLNTSSYTSAAMADILAQTNPTRRPLANGDIITLPGSKKPMKGKSVKYKSVKYKRNEHVEGQRIKSKLWRRAVVHKVHDDDGEYTYDLIWSDTSDKEKRIPASRLRKLQSDDDVEINKENSATSNSTTYNPHTPFFPENPTSNTINPLALTIKEAITSNLLTVGSMSLNITTGEVLNGPFTNVGPTAIADGKAAYDRNFAGLDAIGRTGMTYLEELIDSALRAASNATAATRTGAAVLTMSGVMFAGCNVVSKGDGSLNVSAERSVILKAVSEGERTFVGMVIATDQSADFPLPDGSSREFIAEYGDFPVFVVNRDMAVKRFTSYELFPMARDANKSRATRSETDKIVREMRDQGAHDSRLANGGDVRDWGSDDVVRWLQDVMQVRIHKSARTHTHTSNGLTLGFARVARGLRH